MISVTVIKTGVEFFSAQAIFNAYVSLLYRILVRYMDQSKSQRSENARSPDHNDCKPRCPQRTFQNNVFDLLIEVELSHFMYIDSLSLT